MRRRLAPPKALPAMAGSAKINADTLWFLRELLDCDASSRRFPYTANLLSMTNRIFIDFTIRIANGDSMRDKCAARL